MFASIRPFQMQLSWGRLFLFSQQCCKLIITLILSQIYSIRSAIISTPTNLGPISREAHVILTVLSFICQDIISSEVIEPYQWPVIMIYRAALSRWSVYERILQIVHAVVNVYVVMSVIKKNIDKYYQNIVNKTITSLYLL